PDAPAVGFAREVDYCSGACLIIELDLFHQLGGFDSSYALGYYEDVDLAFRLRERGLRVEYEPRARVYHREGGTAGTDLNEGMKRHQESNRALFAERWSRRLAEQPTRDVGLDLARQRGILGQCLVVDRRLPTPARDGGSKRLVGMLGELRNLDWQVSFAAYDLTDDRVQRQALEAMGVEVLRMPHVASLEGFLSHRGASLDCVVLSRLGVARRLLAPVRRHCPKARVIFDTVDLRSVRESREAALLGDTKAVKRAEKTRRQELVMLREADATIVTSPVERDYLTRQQSGAMVAVVPTCYRTVKPCMKFDRRVGALFVGGFRHGPNRDAILWFLDEVWPRIKLLVPSLQLHVVGEEPPLEITRQASSSVHIHGYVAELSALFERSRLSIAPLRFGAGLKGKVHQSLAHGLPCVATPVAAEGLGLMPDLHAVLAQSANDFAEGVVRLNSDRDLWQRLSIEGQAHVERYFSANALRSGLRSALSAPRR
ncbi:MAG: glycosyltransferase, partial [Acidobacteria bacterium]|nr:glycosyltransferase [Acidobacteriota bacterium]